jgi:hypothetical protein
MAITQCAPTAFKTELMKGSHNLNTAGNTFKIAMYLSSATLNESTTVYTSTGEVSGTAYVAGGNTLTGQVVSSSGTTSFVDFSDTTWSLSTIANARGAMIYNSTSANKAVCILDFGADKSSVGSDFVIQFPSADANNAIIRLV